MAMTETGPALETGRSGHLPRDKAVLIAGEQTR
jgi:hypothetical protein